MKNKIAEIEKLIEKYKEQAKDLETDFNNSGWETLIFAIEIDALQSVIKDLEAIVN